MAGAAAYSLQARAHAPVVPAERRGFSMFPAPLIEPDRFFAAPRRGRCLDGDAQTDAVERFVMRCERLRPHLRTLDALEAFVARLPDAPRIRRRIAIALALEDPGAETSHGPAGRTELEAFRQLAQRRTAAVVWVFG
jgi:hypothetical protein